MPDRSALPLRIYVALSGLSDPLGRLIVAFRRRAGKEDPERWRERFGRTAASRPSGPVIWIHAASVGETVAILPLVARITEAGLGVVLTTVTVTSARFAAGRLPPSVVHQFVPLDMAPYVDKFLDHWKPYMAVFVESEIWPVTIAKLEARKIPLVVSNARMSDRSCSAWARFGFATGKVFQGIDLALAQSETDAQRFEKLGVARVVHVGNIKFDAPIPEASPPIAAALAGAVAERPVWLAASTHPEEETLILDAFERLRACIPGLLLVLAPRHPERGRAVMSAVLERRLQVCLRSTGALPGKGTSVYIADTLGELGTFYRLARVAFVGGSLVRCGGHNPIEAASLGAPVVTGPHLYNFADVYEALQKAGGAEIVADAHGLTEAVARFMLDEKVRERQIAAAKTVVDRYKGSLDRSWSALEPMITALRMSAKREKAEGCS